MKRKRSNIETFLKQTPQDDDGLAPPYTTTTDWRLLLQNSITTEDLRQGCISLFSQIDSDVPLSQTEMDHAVRFLEYATLHNKYRLSSDSKQLETILSEDVTGHTNLTSALLKLVCHPSDTLQMATLSFLDVSVPNSFQRHIHFAAAVTWLLLHLLERLKPHEIPLNGTTIKLHRHLISILDKFFSFSSPETVRHCLEIKASPPLAKTLKSEKLEAIFNPSFVYLRSLVTAPVSPTDTHSGIILLSDTKQFREIVHDDLPHTSFPEVKRFFGEIRTAIVKKLASMLGLSSTSVATLCLRTDYLHPKPAEPWLKGFEYLLGRVSEGTQFSDLGVLAVAFFMNQSPSHLKLVFDSDNEFLLKIKDTIVSSSTLDLKSLWTLFTPTQPHHATTILAAFRNFIQQDHSVTVEKHIWSDWYPNFINVVDPLKLPFTSEFFRFHIPLILLLSSQFTKIRNYEGLCALTRTDQYREELEAAYHAFYTHTKEYVVNLSLHPFALDNGWRDVILKFLRTLNQRDFDKSLNKPYREELRKAMDACALSSSSPPFILTSQLVCHLADDDMLNVVDRIVALLDSDSPLDDDTILRICAFHQHQLSRIYLPDLFRKAGRTTEQYLHAFECLLSLPIDYFDRAPINHLLPPQPLSLQPIFDEWDGVDLESFGIVKRLIDQSQLSVASNSMEHNKCLLDLVIRNLPQLRRHCAARLSQSQSERLFAPSVDVLRHCFIHPSDFGSRERVDRDDLFVDICRLCDQRVIAEYLSNSDESSEIP
ncbi:hypothetical protein BLNAU_8228 [Blattamonas nauphoetae]|uniref:Uncharacterized protein n=1 Tax=Blattamonas nauphoetae TaxID=2049346 RepID=A0ABQ9XZ64_9EUKA|nr:hypothetical protein BLNAU_8228 [Blattamonas nauphoetae]